MPTLVLSTFKNITLSVIFGKGKIQWNFFPHHGETFVSKNKNTILIEWFILRLTRRGFFPSFILYFSFNCRFNLRKRAASDWSLTALIQMIVTLESWHWHWKMFIAQFNIHRPKSVAMNSNQLNAQMLMQFEHISYFL